MMTLIERTRGLKLRLMALSEASDPVTLTARLPAGSWLILRHYDHPDRSVLAARLAPLCRARRIRLLIAGDLALAVKFRAGLHLPQFQAERSLPAARLWRRRGFGPLTIAAHDRRSLARAAQWRADAALLSPVFMTGSHPDRRPLGLLALRRLARSAGVPVIALGGVTAQSLPALRGSGIAGIAAISAFTPPAA